MGLRRTLTDRLPHSAFGDKWHAIITFRRRHGYWPELAPPARFNEHLLKIKIDELDDPLRQRLTDKYCVKQYVTEILGADYTVPTLALLETGADVRDFVFPPVCVVKPTHACRKIFIRKSGRDEVPRDEICSWLTLDYYRHSRERNYRGLQPRVLVEPFVDFNGAAPNDYKFFCFFGRVKLILFDTDRYGDHRRAYLTPDWRQLPFTQNNYPLARPPRPPNLEAMTAIAERLSRDISPVRVDLYSDGRTVLVGELTHCHTASCANFCPEHYDRALAPLFTDPDFDAGDLLKA